MSVFITIDKATDIKRHDDGTAWTWKGGARVAEFRDLNKFVEYVDSHVSELVDCVAFTGSASLLMQANGYIGQKLKEAQLI